MDSSAGDSAITSFEGKKDWGEFEWTVYENTIKKYKNGEKKEEICEKI